MAAKKLRCRCGNCGRYLPTKYCSESGGDCPNCGAHKAPGWYTWAIERRPWPTPSSVEVGVSTGQLLRPFGATRTVYADQLSDEQLQLFINVQLGIEFVADLGITYYPPFSEDMEGEHPDVPITNEAAQSIAGIVGVDQLHNALIIHFGATASAVRASREIAVQAANVAYLAATGFVVGGNVQRELEVERDLREQVGDGTIRYIAEAIAFICNAYDIPFTASVEYMQYSDHPRFWGW